MIDYFSEYKSPQGMTVCKNAQYAETYEEILAPYVGKAVNFAEIGIGYGGCLQVWKWYLGDKAMIYGIDYHTERFYEEPRIKCMVADQTDRDSLRNLDIPELDIFIDDASHRSPDQINTFEVIFPKIKSGGVYVVEDVYCSYRKSYGGGYLNPGSFMEYCKNIVDSFHYSEDERIQPHPMINAIKSFSIYVGMVVIRKK